MPMDFDAYLKALAATPVDAKTEHSDRGALERLLSMPDAQRRDYVQGWVNELLVQEAPQNFREAIACLADDAVAEQAWAAIQQCRR
jgi:hypothetical protein